MRKIVPLILLLAALWAATPTSAQVKFPSTKLTDTPETPPTVDNYTWLWDTGTEKWTWGPSPGSSEWTDTSTALHPNTTSRDVLVGTSDETEPPSGNRFAGVTQEPTLFVSSANLPSIVIGGANGGAIQFVDENRDATADFGVSGNDVFIINRAGGNTYFRHNSGTNALTININGDLITLDAIGLAGTTPLAGSHLDAGPNFAAQSHILYRSGNARYGQGTQSGEYRIFAPDTAGSRIAFGSISDADGTTWTERLRVATDTGAVTSTLALAGSSGTDTPLQILPTYNQTGTAGSTDLMINRTETLLGSGTHYFADWQAGGATYFRMTNTGEMQFPNHPNNQAIFRVNDTLGISAFSTTTLDFFSGSAFLQANVTVADEARLLGRQGRSLVLGVDGTDITDGVEIVAGTNQVHAALQINTTNPGTPGIYIAMESGQTEDPILIYNDAFQGVFRFTPAGTVLLDEKATRGTTTGVAYSDGDTRIYEFADDDLRFMVGSTSRWFMTGTTFGSVANGGALLDEIPSGTNPTVLAQRSQTDTGLGAALSGVISLISSGTEAARVDNTGSANNTRLFLYDVNTASLQRVSVGANGSAGTGYRVLRIPDTP